MSKHATIKSAEVGPEGVTCTGAEVDLRVGGAYRIANRLPDGSIIRITGVFEFIDAPHRLRFSWQIESGKRTLSG